MAFNPVLRSCEEKDQIGLAGVWSFLQPAATAFEVPDKVIYIRLTLIFQIGSLKLQLFSEGHKNLCNRPYSFDIFLVNFKTIRKIAHIFVAFPEKLNFKAFEV